MRRNLRSGGRKGNKAKRSSKHFNQMSWRLPINKDRPIEPLTEEGVQAIHEGAMQIIENIGIEFLNEEAQELFRKAGCKVNDTNVKMDRNWVMEMVREAPSQFSITPRNHGNQIIVQDQQKPDLLK